MVIRIVVVIVIAIVISTVAIVTNIIVVTVVMIAGWPQDPLADDMDVGAREAEESPTEIGNPRPQGQTFSKSASLNTI